MCSILGLLWNVTCGCNISWTDYHSSSCTLPFVCGVDGLIPPLLDFCPSPICLMSCLISAKSSWILSLWCAAWSKSSDRQSWTSLAIISTSSSVIVYFGDVRYAFDLLCAPPVYVDDLLFPPGSCVSRFGVVSCTPSTYFCFSLVSYVLSFFPFWVLVFFGPSSFCVFLPRPVLGLLGTWIFGGCISPYSASSSAVLFGTSLVMVGILHSSGHSLMTMSISPSLMQ
jgi:hypothetical protein